ncbi:hypothetical protein BCY91_09845 [Pelobium manganitolerans]|uniref:Transposase IS200-like domain-containing protein n=1 Tax=Pelobium manganitolerans TaxID=1842495 RepID=A0A419S3H9_9SPHI|nr:transposase [Pelobium manganitolerans]RKD13848.1 hypothetical protein BCY91_09845 [Pelobium manganitolerans]
MVQPLKNRKSPRASWWDYSTPGAYFVTICTKDRVHLFGEIQDRKMQYSHSGIIANIIWYEIKNHFPTVELDEFVVMPNHIHGIININPPLDLDSGSNSDSIVQTGRDDSNIVVGTGRHIVGTGRHIVGTGHALSQPNDAPPNDAEKKSTSLSTIIGSYKSAVTKHCNRLGLPSGWQSRFHDVIIKSENDYERIKNYIINNPDNWKNDDFYNHN